MGTPSYLALARGPKVHPELTREVATSREISIGALQRGESAVVNSEQYNIPVPKYNAKRHELLFDEVCAIL